MRNQSVLTRGTVRSSRSNHVVEEEERKVLRKYTEEEEQRIIRQAKAFPQNLSRGFRIVAEELDRTPGAISNHWYTVTSKRPEAICFFTASEKHVSKNRKNGMGVESTPSIWRRLMAVIRNL